jgi:hypothetical protein
MEPVATKPDGAPSRSQESAASDASVATDVAAGALHSERAAGCAPTSGAASLLTIKRALGARASDQGFLPIEATHYFMLLDWTGREVRRDKSGAIPAHLSPILDRVGLNRSTWLETVQCFGRMFKRAAGRSSSMADAAARRSRRWFQGTAAARVAFL